MYDYRKNLKDCIFSYEICCSELKIKEWSEEIILMIKKDI